MSLPSRAHFCLAARSGRALAKQSSMAAFRASRSRPFPFVSAAHCRRTSFAVCLSGPGRHCRGARGRRDVRSGRRRRLRGWRLRDSDRAGEAEHEGGDDDAFHGGAPESKSVSRAPIDDARRHCDRRTEPELNAGSRTLRPARRAGFCEIRLDRHSRGNPKPPEFRVIHEFLQPRWSAQAQRRPRHTKRGPPTVFRNATAGPAAISRLLPRRARGNSPRSVFGGVETCRTTAQPI